MSCRCVKYHSFGITVFEISDGRYIYIYITEPRCGRDLKRPLHRLVRQLRSSSLDPTTLGRKVQKRCARQKKKKSFERFGFGTCGLSVAVCERVV